MLRGNEAANGGEGVAYARAVAAAVHLPAFARLPPPTQKKRRVAVRKGRESANMGSAKACGRENVEMKGRIRKQTAVRGRSRVCRPQQWVSTAVQQHAAPLVEMSKCGSQVVYAWRVCRSQGRRQQGMEYNTNARSV